jgi:predicted nucleic acid-binding protein
MDADGKQLSKATYHYGDTVVAPEAPTKEADSTYTYTFSGWDKEVVACAGNAIYRATYTSEYIDYTVVFMDADGKQLSKATYHYGDTVVVPEAPTKEADSTYTYTFSGWDQEVVPCTKDAVYTAVFTAHVRGVRVSGTVTSFGSETDNVILQLIAEGYSEADYEVIVQGNTAAYSIEGVAAGTYTLRVVKNNHVTRTYTVTVDTDPVVQDAKLHLIGDVDGNGDVNMGDISQLYAHIRRTALITDEYMLLCADVTGEGDINMGDISKTYAHIRRTSLLW